MNILIEFIIWSVLNVLYWKSVFRARDHNFLHLPKRLWKKFHDACSFRTIHYIVPQNGCIPLHRQRKFFLRILPLDHESIDEQSVGQAFRQQLQEVASINWNNPWIKTVELSNEDFWQPLSKTCAGDDWNIFSEMLSRLTDGSML